MKSRYFFFVLICVFFGGIIESGFAQQPSLDRGGREFWVSVVPTVIADPEYNTNIQPDYRGDTLRLVISTDAPTHIELTIPNTSWKRSVYTKDSLTYVITIPKDNIVPRLFNQPESKGLFVQADRPVSVSCYNMISAMSDATHIYPVQMLDKEYIVSFNLMPSKHPLLYNPAFIVLVATVDATLIDIEPSRPEWGSNRQISLNRGQIYLLKRNIDPTGMRLNATKPIAVFSGAFGQNPGDLTVPGFYGSGCANVVYDQLLPVSQWSKEYYVVQMDASKEIDKYPTWTRILASDNNTSIQINGKAATLQRGKWLDTMHTVPLYIHADKPVTITQMGSGIKHPIGNFPTGTRLAMGDGTFMQLIGKEKMQSGRNVLTTVPYYGDPDIFKPGFIPGLTALDYITIIAATSEISEIYLDRKNIASDFKAFEYDNTMSYAQISVSKWKHEIWSIGRYHLYSYGWNFCEAHSNAVGVGLGARKAAISYASPCLGESFELRGVAEKGAVRWTWDFADGTPEVETATLGNTAAGDDFTKVTHTFLKDGTYPVRLRVLYDWSNGVEDTIWRDVVVPELPAPVVTADKPVLCFGESTRLRATTGFKSYTWTLGGEPIATNPVVPHEQTVFKSGEYSVAVTDEKGCSNSATTVITVLPELIAGITGAKESCINSTETYRAEGVQPNITLGWAVTGGTLVSGQGTPVIGVRWTTQGTGLLKLEMRDAVTGCFKDTTISVEIGTGLNVAIAGNLAICDGTPTLLKAESGAGSDAEFEWYFNGNLLKGETQQTLLANKTGTYRVKVTSATGCIGEATAEVKASALPEKPIIAGQPILCDDNSMTTLTLMNPEKYARFEWFYGNELLKDETVPILTVLKTGQYSITVYNDAGCKATTEVNVTQLTLSMSNDTTVCSGQSVELSAESNEPNATFSWSPQAGLTNANIQNPVATPDVTTTYHVTLTTADGSCTRTDSVTITVLKTPVITTKDISLCEGESAELWAMSDEPVVSWSWTPATGLSNPNIQNPIVTAFKSQVYTVAATNENGCTVVKTLTVTVKEKENITAVLKSDKSELEPGESTNVQFLLKAENKLITSFKAVVHFDSNVFQFTKNSGKFLNGADNTWFLQADIIAPGELDISANGQTPIAMSELAFELTAYLEKQTTEDILLKLTEINGEVLKEEELCRTIETESTKLVLKEVCAGDMRLVNVGEFETTLQQITPNPATSETIEIDYSVGIEGVISLEIYNSQGELLKTIYKGNQKAGIFKETFSTEEIPAGVFLVKLSTLQATETQMFTIVK